MADGSTYPETMMKSDSHIADVIVCLKADPQP